MGARGRKPAQLGIHAVVVPVRSAFDVDGYYPVITNTAGSYLMDTAVLCRTPADARTRALRWAQQAERLVDGLARLSVARQHVRLRDVPHTCLQAPRDRRARGVCARCEYDDALAGVA